RTKNILKINAYILPYCSHSRKKCSVRPALQCRNFAPLTLIITYCPTTPEHDTVLAQTRFTRKQ
ncbi:hypothetical protein J6590_107156, partial [Homalodisca vitripennis]